MSYVRWTWTSGIEIRYDYCESNRNATRPIETISATVGPAFPARTSGVLRRRELTTAARGRKATAVPAGRQKR